MTNGVENIKFIVDILTAIITILSVILVLYMAHWSLPILLFVSMIPSVIAIISTKTMSYKKNVKLIEKQREQAYISSFFMNKNILKEMKIFNLGDFFLFKWKDIYRNVVSSQIDIFKREEQIKALALIASQIFTAMINIYLIYLILRSNVTVGDYVALTTAISTFQGAVAQIIANFGQMLERSLYNVSFFEVINEDKDKCQKQLGTIGDFKEIELKNISFSYPNSNRKCVNNISLNIKRGDRIALVGSNGCGKSTLINIIMGIYSQCEGKIIINGQELNEGMIKDYQSKFTVVLQDFSRYKLSIRENIGIGNVDKIDDDNFINTQLNKVNLYDYVNKLPHNIDTKLSKEFEDGTELSGGQWQKIAISRAIAKESDIIIFDEPTSALDPLAEMEIFNLLRDVSKDKTIIMISHRLGVSKYADKICYIEDGSIVEQGTHDELINMNGKYRNMYDIQKKWYK